MRLQRYLQLALALGFVLGVHNGNVALWQDGTPEPLRVFPYQASLLPEADRLALEEGIHLDSQEDLQRLLEDYLS